MKTFTFGKKYPVTLHEETLALMIQAPGGDWQSISGFVPHFLSENGDEIPFSSAQSVTITPVSTGVADGVWITLSGFPSDTDQCSAGFSLLILQLHTGELRFEFIPLTEERMTIREVCWPAPLERMDQAMGRTVFPMMQGMLLDDGSPKEAHTFLSGMVLSREAIMPWWGQYTDGGYLAVVDTPWDARLDYHHMPHSRTSVAVRWIGSLGKMGYRRILHYEFMERCDYVSLAKAFRSYVKSTGGLTTLEEKMIKNPLVRRMIGTPVVNTPAALSNCQPESPFYDPAHPEKNHVLCSFDELAKLAENLDAKGLKNAYYHIDGWGAQGYDNLHPDILPPCEEAGGADGLRRLLEHIRKIGGLSALHDQYRDYYTRAESFDEKNAVQLADGSLYRTNEWLGGEQLALCTQLAQDYITRNYDGLKEAGISPDGVYLDVFSVIELDECDNPEHRMSRKECMEKRIACMEAIRARGMLISSEEPMYGFVSHLDLVHHGPWLYALYEVLHMDSPMIPVPLFNLVYHDCLLIPWFTGRDGWGLPPGESGFLYGLLNGGLPMVPSDARSSDIEAAQVMCRLHERVGCLEMTEHSFLEGRKQRSVFADQTAVTVDFEAETYEIAWPDGQVTTGCVK